MKFNVIVANKSHTVHAAFICNMMEEAAKKRGTGISKRKPEYIQDKITEGKAVIAFHEGWVIGFCYIESWDNEKFVANSGLIVHPDFRKTGVAKLIKKRTFDLSKKLFPTSRLFGITTSHAVMKINSDLGYKPVTFSELTKSDAFWKGCQECKNYDILDRMNRTMCLCTAMICDFNESREQESEKHMAWERFKSFIKRRKSKKTNILKIKK
ncbi:MAG: N-acetylglutamate synthase-like GNAT family acetyltransferase [Flavobacteriaceae bacterium]|jgi:N-acetylglutamate synthase-like GNAT family acetyltransferase